jgi:hypothetical protein
VAQVTASTFTYKSNFPSITDAQIVDAVDYVENVFYGCLTLWAATSVPRRTNLRLRLENLLVAWYLSAVNPLALVGIQSSGGMPMNAKSIGGEAGTSITYTQINVQDALVQLSTNTYGQQAIMMIESCPERATLFGG